VHRLAALLGLASNIGARADGRCVAREVFAKAQKDFRLSHIEWEITDD
jgi:hypothetical protein